MVSKLPIIWTQTVRSSSSSREVAAAIRARQETDLAQCLGLQFIIIADTTSAMEGASLGKAVDQTTLQRTEANQACYDEWLRHCLEYAQARRERESHTTSNMAPSNRAAQWARAKPALLRLGLVVSVDSGESGHFHAADADAEVICASKM